MSSYLVLITALALLDHGVVQAMPAHSNTSYQAVNQRARRVPTVTSSAWSSGANMPDPVELAEVASIIVDSVIYIIGGRETHTVRYDIASDTWSQRDFLTHRPLPGDHHSMVALNTKESDLVPELYVLGGFDKNSEQTIQIYNIESNKWRLAGKLPWDVHGSIAAVAIGNILYACGGLKLGEAHHAGTNPNDCYSFDPLSSQWNKFAKMPTGVDHAATCTDGAKMYVFGGRNTGHNIPAMGLNIVQIYDPTSDEWSYGDPMPAGRGGFGAVYVNGIFVVFGGESRTAVFPETFFYDGATWSNGPNMITARHGIAPLFDSVTNKIYVGGGGTKQGPSKSAVMEILSISIQNGVTLTSQPTLAPTENDLSKMSCNELAWNPSQTVPRVCVSAYITANGKCYSGKATLSEAEQVCADRNARLCSVDEMENNAGAGTGCRLDRKRIWTKDTCGDGTQHYVIGASKKFAKKFPTAIDKECIDSDEKFPVRCCADSYIRTEATVSPELGGGGGGVVVVAPVVPSTSTKSCDDLGWRVRSKTKKICASSFSSDGECHAGEVVHSRAVAICSATGARLCTPAELKKNVAKGTGCTLDRSRVWSAKVCGDGTQYYAVGASTKYADTFPSLPIQECVDATETFPVRCCADTVVLTSSPSVPGSFKTYSPSTSPSDSPITMQPTASPSLYQAPTSTKTCLGLGWDVAVGDTVCGHSKINPLTSTECMVGRQTYEEAAEACEAIGARLCTGNELKRDTTRDTGCSLDRKRVWSSTTCDGGFNQIGGSSEFNTKFPDATVSECTVPTDLAGTRCCADTEVATADPTESPVPSPTISPQKSIYTVPQIRKWKEFTTMPNEHLMEAQGLAADGRLWVFGGFTDGLFKKMGKKTFSYTPGSKESDGEWRQHSDIPIGGGITHSGQAFGGTNIYIVGGMATIKANDAFPNAESVSTSLAYNIQSDSWTSLPDLPETRAGGGCVHLDGKIYYFGGGTFVPFLKFTVDHKEHWVLDLESDSPKWKQLASISLGRNHMGAAVFNGKIYAIGGQFLENEWKENQDLVEVYHVDSNTWTIASPLPSAMGHITPGVFATAHGIFVLGGYSNARERLKHNLFFYSPLKDEWIELEAHLYGPSQVAAIIDDRLYAIYRQTGYSGKVHWINP